MISIHALREEGDEDTTADRQMELEFLSTPSARRATRTAMIRAAADKFLSTPSARRATEGADRAAFLDWISIHALREEGDQAPQTRKEQAKYFYPRPPRGGRLFVQRDSAVIFKFLSTPSARRATDVIHKTYSTEEFLSTPSARRATNA